VVASTSTSYVRRLTRSLLLIATILVGCIAANAQGRPCEKWAKRGLTIYYSWWTAVHNVEPSVSDVISYAYRNCETVSIPAYDKSYQVRMIDSLRGSSSKNDSSMMCHSTPRIVVVYRTKHRSDTLVFRSSPAGMTLNGKCFPLNNDLLYSFLVLIPYQTAKVVVDKLKLESK